MRQSLYLFAAIFMILSICAFSTAFAQAPCDCGDANCDGNLNIGDFVTIFGYLYTGSQAPATGEIWGADWDGYRDLSMSDCIIAFIYSTPEKNYPTCGPDLPILNPPTIPEYAVSYVNRICPGSIQGSIALSLQAENTMGIQLPLLIRIDDMIPTIDSIAFSFTDPLIFAGGTIYSAEGAVAIGVIGDLWLPVPLEYSTEIATIYFTLPEPAPTGTIDLQWASLNPVNSPDNDDFITPLLVADTLETLVIPAINSSCCLLPGDANDDGTVDLGDAIALIQCVFLEICNIPCLAQANANADSAVNIGDAVYLVNYIFKNGPAPLCGNTF